MGMFDSMKDKVQELAGQHPDKVEELSDQGIGRAGDAVDSATGGKYADKIDQGQGMADEKIGEANREGSGGA